MKVVVVRGSGRAGRAVGVTSASGHEVLTVERVPSVDQTSAAPILRADLTTSAGSPCVRRAAS